MPRPHRPPGRSPRAGPAAPVRFGLALALALAVALTLPSAARAAAEVDSDTPWPEKQKLREDSLPKRVALAPVRVLAWPGRQLLGGMEDGLLYVEEERVLVRIANFQRRLAERGLYPQYGGLGDGAGLGFGILIRGAPLEPAAPHVELRAAASIKNFHAYELAYAVPALAGPLGARVGASYARRPQEDFFGLGRDSGDEERTNYLAETIGAALEVTLRPPGGRPPVEVGAAARIRRVNIGGGTDPRFPDTRELFAPEDVPGLARGADVLSVEAEIERDTVDRSGAPGGGGRLSLAAGVFEAVDGEPLAYARYRAEAIRFLSLYPGRVLAFRALGVITDRRGDEEAAFFDLPELGGSASMRGFREHRFRDRDAALFTLEYRWQLWGGMDAVLFADEGSVFRNLEDEFRFERLRTSYGGGFRLKSPAGVFFRYEVGHSNEGTRHFFKFNESF